MRLYLGGIFTEEDEYKFVCTCTVSNSAAFDDFELPWTLVSRSRYSLKVNISQTVHSIHSIFGSSPWVFGVGGWRYFRFNKIQDGVRRPSWVYILAMTSQLVCRSTWYLVLGLGLQLSIDFYHRCVHTRIAVARITLASARLSCCQSCQCQSLNYGTFFCEFRPPWYPI